MGKSKRSNKEGQYLSLSYYQLRSPAWRSLSGAGVKVLLELHTRFNGTNNGRVFLSLNEAAELLGMGKATAKRAFDELQEKGFIVQTKKGNWYNRAAHEWRLTLKPSFDGRGKRTTPTHDWKEWRPAPKDKGSGI